MEKFILRDLLAVHLFFVQQRGESVYVPELLMHRPVQREYAAKVAQDFIC